MKLINLFFIFLLIPTIIAMESNKNNSEVISSSSQLIKLSIPIVDNSSLVSEEELMRKTIKEIAEIYGINSEIYANELSKYYNIEINEKDSFQSLCDKVVIDSSEVKEIALNIKNQISIVEKTKNEKKHYAFFVITSIFILFCLIGFFILKKKTFSYKKLN